jgi:hypothetical protein
MMDSNSNILKQVDLDTLRAFSKGILEHRGNRFYVNTAVLAGSQVGLHASLAEEVPLKPRQYPEGHTSSENSELMGLSIVVIAGK